MSSRAAIAGHPTARVYSKPSRIREREGRTDCRILPKPWIEPVGREYGLELFDSCRTRRVWRTGEHRSVDDDNGTFSSWSTGGRLGAVIEPSVRDVARKPGPMSPSRTSETLASHLAADAPLPQPGAQPALAPRVTSKESSELAIRDFRALRRLWIPLLILVVIGAGGLTVARLHGIFGSENGGSVSRYPNERHRSLSTPST